MIGDARRVLREGGQGIIGGGMAHIRLADGSHRFIDGQSTVPKAVRPDTYTSKPGSARSNR